MRGHYPVRPFGLALYFSLNVEREYEKTGGRYDFAGILARVQGKAGTAMYNGAATGYIVSTNTIDLMSKAMYPTGWVTSDIDKMPAEERQKLESIAPVYDMDKGNTFPSPISFTTGLCGYAFVDQDNKTVIIIWRRGRNTSVADESGIDNGALNATLSFSGIKDGRYTVTDIFDASKTFKLDIAQGKGSFDVTVDRWDCRAFVSDIVTPNNPDLDIVPAMPLTRENPQIITLSIGGVDRGQVFNVQGQVARRGPGTKAAAGERFFSRIYVTKAPSVHTIKSGYKVILK
jgi:hypothetical protein